MRGSPWISTTRVILISGVLASASLYPREAILQVVLIRHSEEDDVALALEFLNQALSAGKSGAVVIGPDEEEALALGSVRVDGNNRDSCRYGFVNAFR